MRVLVKTFDESLELPDECNKLYGSDIESCIKQAQRMIQADVDWAYDGCYAKSVQLDRVTPRVWRMTMEIDPESILPNSKLTQKDYYRIVDWQE